LPQIKTVEFDQIEEAQHSGMIVMPGAEQIRAGEAVGLADAIGQADALLKGAEAECKALKEEFKTRGLLTASVKCFIGTRSDHVSSRLDINAVAVDLREVQQRMEELPAKTRRPRAVERGP
jgi:hypothetical protein